MPRNDPTDTGGLFIGRRPGTAPPRFRVRPAEGSPGRRRFDRALAVALLLLETLLCLSLFGPQPLGWLWVGSQVQYLTGFVTAGTSGQIELARRRVPDDRIQPVNDMQTAARMRGSGHCAKCWSNTHKPADRCEHCQHRERHPH